MEGSRALPNSVRWLHMRAMSNDAAGEVASLLPWSRTLREADGRSRIRALVEAKDAVDRVQALAPLEAYQAIKAIGPHDAAGVLALLSERQTRALLDLDVWHAHELDVSDVLIWFEAFRAGGLDALVKAARALDGEALALVLRRRLHICFKPKDDSSDPDPLPDWAANPSEALQPLVETADGRFIVAARVEDEESEALVDDEERKAILQLVAELYRDEKWEFVAGILRSAMSDLSSSLHEDALRFRDARLEDLGFPPLVRALEIYGPLEADALKQGQAPVYPALEDRLPAVYAAPLTEGLFHAAMAELEDFDLVRRIEGDLVPLANAALVADGAEPGQVEHLQDTLSRARGYIELALAHGTPAGPERLEVATGRIAANHVSTLFRVGYTLTLKAATRARALAANAAFEQDGLPLARLEEGERVTLDALRAKRPRVSLALGPRLEAARSGGDPLGLGFAPQLEATRPFLSPEDLAAVEATLDDLEGLAAALEARAPALAEASLAEAQVPAEERTAGLFIGTCVARALLEVELGVAPLDGAQLRGLAGRARSGAAAEAAVSATAAWFGAGQGAIRRRAAASVAGLVEAFGADASADPRFVEGLLVTPAT